MNFESDWRGTVKKSKCSVRQNLDKRPLELLKTALERIGKRPDRESLCAGLLDFLSRGLLVYKECRTTSGPRPAFSANGHVLDSVRDILAATEQDARAWALLHSVATCTVVFDVNSKFGKLDVVFSGTEACFGPIHYQ
jgi:hypothetical protein